MILEWRRIKYRSIQLPYEVSESGHVRRIAGKDCIGRNRKSNSISPHDLGKGYEQVILQSDRKRYSPLVHSLVAFAFLADPPGEYGPSKIIINHKDGNKKNNHFSNLEWVTPKQNSEHAVAIGLIANGEAASNAKLTVKKVRQIRKYRANGVSQSFLAKKFGVSKYAIYAISINKTWRHV